MTKKPLQFNGRQFASSLFGALAFIVLGLLAIAAITYTAGVNLSEFIDQFNSNLNHS